MTTSMPDQEPDIGAMDAAMFAAEWLDRHPELSVRTPPVVAVVRELLDVLRDEHTPAPDAYAVFCRAVRLLAVFAVDTGPRRSRAEDSFPLPDWVPSKDRLARSVESARFATAALRGTPQEAIRTQPIIAVVQRLHDILLTRQIPARQAHLAFCRAVRLLDAFTTDQPRSRHDQIRHASSAA
jgi:hypothetical protein